MAGSKALAALALPFAILSFCAWCVYVGGLAAVQARCSEEPGFFANQNYPGSSCGHVFSYWWFVMAINFVTILAVIAMCASGGVAWTRLALLGMVTVCFILYIQASYWFTNILWSTPAYDSMDQPDHRMRTLVAGAIMTATFNGLLLICLGIVDPRRELYNANSQAKAMTGNTDTYNTGAHVPGTGAHVPGTGTHIPGTHTTNVV